MIVEALDYTNGYLIVKALDYRVLPGFILNEALQTR